MATKDAPTKKRKRSSAKKKGGPKKKRNQKIGPPEMSQDELQAAASEFVAQQAKAKDSPYRRITSITEVTTKGRPARVIIECVDPQTAGDGNSVCEGTREIAIQDLFQVVRCVPCQKRSVQLYRNKLARKRRAEHAALRGDKKKAPSKKKAASKKKARKKRSKKK